MSENNQSTSETERFEPSEIDEWECSHCGETGSGVQSAQNHFMKQHPEMCSFETDD